MFWGFTNRNMEISRWKLFRHRTTAFTWSFCRTGTPFMRSAHPKTRSGELFMRVSSVPILAAKGSLPGEKFSAAWSILPIRTGSSSLTRESPEFPCLRRKCYCAFVLIRGYLTPRPDLRKLRDCAKSNGFILNNPDGAAMRSDRYDATRRGARGLLVDYCRPFFHSVNAIKSGILE